MVDASYSGKYEEYFEYPRREMLDFVPVGTRRLLEVGCGSASFAVLLKQRAPVHVTAVEAHEPSAARARERVDRLLCASIETALPSLAGERFDCIVLNDVLEHLVDPWQALAQLKPLLAPEGVVVASLPNVRYLPVFKDYVFRALWRYQDDGVLDRTHLRFFSHHSMRELFDFAGLEVQRLEGINPTAVSWKFGVLDFVTRGALADTRFKQFACVARARAGAP